MRPSTSSWTSERSERDPGPITTNLRVARSWGHGFSTTGTGGYGSPAFAGTTQSGCGHLGREIASVSHAQLFSDTPDAPRRCSRADARLILWLRHRWPAPPLRAAP